MGSNSGVGERRCSVSPGEAGQSDACFGSLVCSQHETATICPPKL
jgi:hypothetical protein